jgi:hypothetical protein
VGGTPEAKILELAGQWLAYVNLWTLESVRPVALYSKSDTRLNMTPVRQLTLGSPTWIQMATAEEEEDHWQPLVSVRVDDAARLAAFMCELEQGRQSASRSGPRLETALRWFRRVADGLFGLEEASIDIPPSLYEDMVVNSITALESLLLRKEERSKKKDPISRRLACLVAENDVERAAIEKRVRDNYDLRSAIVHGDTQPAVAELQRATNELRVWLRQVLVAALRMGGEQRRFVDAVKDASVRDSNQRLVPRYRER